MMLLQLGSDWCKVRLENGKLGYVKTQYILCYPDAPVQKQEVYKATSKTYVYESMSTSSKKLATIPKGGEAAVTSNPKKGWWYGSYNGVTGYMRTKYVVKSTSVVYPVLDAAATPAPGGGISSGGGISAGNGSSTGGGISAGSSGSSGGSISAGGGISSGGNTATPAPTPAPTPTPGSGAASGTRVKEGTQALSLIHI